MRVKLPRSALPLKANNSTSSSLLDSPPSEPPVLPPDLLLLLVVLPLLKLRKLLKSLRKKSTWEVFSVVVMTITEQLSRRPV